VTVTGASLGPDTWWLIGRILLGLALLVALGISTLAFIGYRRNGSRSMLYLSTGLVTLTVGAWLVKVLSIKLLPNYLILLTDGLTQLIGLGLLLYAILLAHRQ